MFLLYLWFNMLMMSFSTFRLCPPAYSTLYPDPSSSSDYSPSPYSPYSPPNLNSSSSLPLLLSEYLSI